MMAEKHLSIELIAYLRGELTAEEAVRISAHLQTCGECRAEAAASRAVLEALGRSLPTPPAIHWGRYRAELRGRLEADRARGMRSRWLRPLPLALTAAAMGVVVLVVSQSGLRRAPVTSDPIAAAEQLLGRRPDLVRQYPVVERLDLLENLDVIEHLDRLAAAREG